METVRETRQRTAADAASGVTLWTTQQAAANCAIKYSVFRHLRSLGLAPLPVGYRGAVAYFDPADIEAWNAARLANRATAQEIGKLPLTLATHEIELDLERLKQGAEHAAL